MIANIERRSLAGAAHPVMATAMAHDPIMATAYSPIMASDCSGGHLWVKIAEFQGRSVYRCGRCGTEQVI